jgi:hypothetical protein
LDAGPFAKWPEDLRAALKKDDYRKLTFTFYLNQPPSQISLKHYRFSKSSLTARRN